MFDTTVLKVFFILSTECMYNIKEALTLSDSKVKYSYRVYCIEREVFE